MGKTKYQSSWQSNYEWLQLSKKSVNHAFCGVCSTNVSIAADVTQVQLNEKSKKYCSSLKSCQVSLHLFLLLVLCLSVLV